jgi:hypothetical protein
MFWPVLGHLQGNHSYTILGMISGFTFVPHIEITTKTRGNSQNPLELCALNFTKIIKT